MNAVALAYGPAIGGPEGARDKLTEFWRTVSRAGQLFNPVGATPLDAWLRMCGVWFRAEAQSVWSDATVAAA